MNRAWRRWASRKGVQLPAAIMEEPKLHRGYWRDIIRHRWPENMTVTVRVDAAGHPVEATVRAS